MLSYVIAVLGITGVIVAWAFVQSAWRRAFLDGTGAVTILSGLVYPLDVVVDPLAGKLYLRSGASPAIERMNLDGTNRTTLVTNAGNLALDIERQHLYYAYQQGIWRINTNGSSPVEVVSGITSGTVQGISLDTQAELIYWSEGITNAIRRAGFDGQNVVTIANTADDSGHPGSANPFGALIDPQLKKPQFRGREVFRCHIVSGGWHDRILLM